MDRVVVLRSPTYLLRPQNELLFAVIFFYEFAKKHIEVARLSKNFTITPRLFNTSVTLFESYTLGRLHVHGNQCTSPVCTNRRACGKSMLLRVRISLTTLANGQRII